MNSRIQRILAISLILVGGVGLALWPGVKSTPERLLQAAKERVKSDLFRALRSKGAGGVYDTTDRYLDSLQIPFPSEEVLKAFATIPDEDAMVFITSGNDAQTELAYRSISYLGWPRPIGEVRCNPDGSAESLFAPPAERPIKWLFFHQIAPPADFRPRSKTIGHRLTITPVSELKDWKSYCSH